MRNLLDDAPSRDLHTIALQATRFVADADIRDREVLDVGCGFGWFELFAIDAGVQHITGIEITERDLQTARRHIDAPNVTFQVAGATELPFPDNSFDTVVCWEVLEHIPRKSEPRAFSEIARVLRPGGTFYMSTPHASLVARVTDPAWWLIGHRHYHKRDLTVFAGDAGLSVELLEVRGGAWLITSILNMYVAKWVFRRRPFFAELFDRRVDAELAAPDGFAGCFMKCRA
jgi:2-polyprenyl-3-methyl-5-hydroxy-6-metoxy-1,4-benzoquinol methylase